MRTVRRPPRTLSLIERGLRVTGVLVTMATAPFAAAPTEAQATPEPRAASHVWLDAAGEPLPFQTHREILDYLRNAEVVDRSPTNRGVAGTERILMDRGGIRVHAAFRTVDETHRGPFENLPASVRRVRDAAVFECAAYELSEALGFGRVPPTVWRKIGNTTGSVQIWLEEAMTQDGFGEHSVDPSDVARWNLQKRLMYVFDALIANTDRNQGNIMVGRDGTLWFIDHTLTFALTQDLLKREQITRCSRDLWLALRDFDEASVQQRLEPFLRKGELKVLFKRRIELVAHIEHLVTAHGEPAVLFEIDPPTSDTRPHLPDP